MTPEDQNFTVKEIVIGIRDKLDAHLAASNESLVEVERELGKRPTRGELGKWLGALGVLVGIVVGIISLAVV